MAPILYLFKAGTNYLLVICYSRGLPVLVLSQKASAADVSSTSAFFWVLLAILAGEQPQRLFFHYRGTPWHNTIS